MWPETPKATVRRHERHGCEVDFPEARTCCGQMTAKSGYADRALPLVRRFVDVFGGYDAIVGRSWSYVGWVRHQDRTVVVGDNSCLARIGGILGRQRTEVRTMHRAEILAWTEGDPA